MALGSCRSAAVSACVVTLPIRPFVHPTAVRPRVQLRLHLEGSDTGNFFPSVVATLCRTKATYEAGVDLYRALRRGGVQPTTYMFAAMIAGASCAEVGPRPRGNPERSLAVARQLWQEMLDSGMEPNAETFWALIKVWGGALALLACRVERLVGVSGGWVKDFQRLRMLGVKLQSPEAPTPTPPHAPGAPGRSRRAYIHGGPRVNIVLGFLGFCPTPERLDVFQRARRDGHVALLGFQVLSLPLGFRVSSSTLKNLNPKKTLGAWMPRCVHLVLWPFQGL